MQRDPGKQDFPLQLSIWLVKTSLWSRDLGSPNTLLIRAWGYWWSVFPLHLSASPGWDYKLAVPVSHSSQGKLPQVSIRWQWIPGDLFPRDQGPCSPLLSPMFDTMELQCANLLCPWNWILSRTSSWISRPSRWPLWGPGNTHGPGQQHCSADTLQGQLKEPTSLQCCSEFSEFCIHSKQLFI